MTTSTKAPKAAPKAAVKAVDAAKAVHVSSLAAIDAAVLPNLVSWVKAVAADMNSGLLKVVDVIAVLKESAEQGVSSFGGISTSHAQHFQVMAALSDLGGFKSMTELATAAVDFTSIQTAGKGETKTANALKAAAAAVEKGANFKALKDGSRKKAADAKKARAARPDSGGKVEVTQGLTVDMVNGFRELIENLDPAGISEDLGAALNELACVISDSIND